MAEFVHVNLSRLRHFREAIARDLRRGSNGPIRRGLKQWAAIYRGAMQERFVEMSRGGWPPLAESTKKRRRKARKGHKGSRSFAVLRDTGTLFNALSPTFSSKPGQYEHDIPFGVRVGYGGPHKHPRGKATIADIASFHQAGKGHLPARPIIVRPSDPTIRKMADVMQQRINELTRG